MKNKQISLYGDNICFFNNQKEVLAKMVGMPGFVGKGTETKGLRTFTKKLVAAYNHVYFDIPLPNTLIKEQPEEKIPPIENCNWVQEMEDVYKIHYPKLKEENTRLKEHIEIMKRVLNECSGYFSASNFTDRYGTADRIKEILKQVTKYLNLKN